MLNAYVIASVTLLSKYYKLGRGKEVLDMNLELKN